MSRLLLICFISLSSILSFSEKIENKEQNKKANFELKAMIHSGYDVLVRSGTATIKAEVNIYKRFDVKSAIFNVGAGIDFTNFFNKESYVGVIRPYLVTEIGGYVSKNVRMYTDLKLGGTLFFRNTLSYDQVLKTGVSLGMTYKERFTAEIGFDYPSSFTLGLGARFGF